MLTLPTAYTRRFYKDNQEEIVISCCNHCLAVVAESSDESELQWHERQHRCSEKAESLAA